MRPGGVLADISYHLPRRLLVLSAANCSTRSAPRSSAPRSFRLRLTSLIQSYDIETDRWAIGGSFLCTSSCDLRLARGRLFCTAGRRDPGAARRLAGANRDHSWQASSLGLLQVRGRSRLLPGADRKRVVLVSHDLTLSGAPLFLLELARAMRDGGAVMQLFSLADDAAAHGSPTAPASRAPVETAEHSAAGADLVIANAAVGVPSLRSLLAAHPAGRGAPDLIVHEKTRTSSRTPGRTNAVRTALFDSADARAPGDRRTSAALNVWSCIRKPRCARPANGAERAPWGEGGQRRGLRVGDPRATQPRRRHLVLCCVGTYQPRKGQALLRARSGGSRPRTAAAGCD